MNEGGSFGSLSRLAHGVFDQNATTLPGRLLQFAVNATLGTLVSVFILRTFFPSLLSHSPAPAATPAPGTINDYGARYN